MGFMLIQCALGAYIAAIIHLILHGLFKATLFLQAGSAVRRFEGPTRTNDRSSYFLIMAGRTLGLVVGAAFWLMAPSEGYQLISALILGWSLSVFVNFFLISQPLMTANNINGIISKCLTNKACPYDSIQESVYSLKSTTNVIRMSPEKIVKNRQTRATGVNHFKNFIQFE